MPRVPEGEISTAPELPGLGEQLQPYAAEKRPVGISLQYPAHDGSLFLVPLENLSDSRHAPVRGPGTVRTGLLGYLTWFAGPDGAAKPTAPLGRVPCRVQLPSPPQGPTCDHAVLRAARPSRQG